MNPNAQRPGGPEKDIPMDRALDHEDYVAIAGDIVRNRFPDLTGQALDAKVVDVADSIEAYEKARDRWVQAKMIEPASFIEPETE